MPHILAKLTSSFHRMKPGQILVFGFFSVILLGAVLLTLPGATADRYRLDFLDALFTSTSAVCVTGLVVVNTGVTFTVFGQVVIICLIQIGGLGFMTVASLIFMMLGKRFSLRERLVIQEAYNLDSNQGVVKLVRHALQVTFAVEGMGALLLSFRLIPEFGVAKGIYHAVFLAVSAFCNAGFDALGQASSLDNYVADPAISIIIMLLITIGGLGFGVIMDILRHRRFKKLMLQSRIVLLVSGGLFVSGALLIAILEWNNPQTLGEHSVPVKILGSCFQSVTLRTAGFETIPQGAMTPASKLVSVIYMFVGASPASTGGGIKTTTFFIMLLTVSCMVRGKQDYNVFHRHLNDQLIRKSVAIFSMALGLVLVDTVVISGVEYATGGTEMLSDVLFEVASAFGTVGLSTGITPTLYPLSKILIILTMFTGRLGPLTLSTAIANATSKPDALHYPEERLIVG